MKKILFLGFIALTALTVTSCSNDEVMEAVPQKQAIEFGTYLGRDAQARAAELETAGLQAKGFGVFASYTNTENWTTSAKPNFMFNQEVTYNTTSTAWEYSPIKYWPESAGKISFFAYGPLKNYDDTPTETVTEKSTNTVAGAPTVTFTQSTDVTKMVDFVAAVSMNETYDENKTDNTVEFTFKHELTRVSFSAKLGEGYYVADLADKANKTMINIKSVKINKGNKFIASADYTFASADANAGTWGTQTIATTDLTLDGILNKQTPNITGATVYNVEGILVNSNTNAVTLFQANQYAFLIPYVQTETPYITGLTPSDEIEVTFTYDIITLDVALENGYSCTTDTKTAKIKGAATPTILQQGKAYNITFAIGLKAIVLDVTEVSDWATPVYGVDASTEDLP